MWVVRVIDLLRPSGVVLQPPVVADPDLPGWWRGPISVEKQVNDLWLALALFGGGLLSMSLWEVVGLHDDPAPTAVSVLIVAATVLPLAVRRRWPSAVAVIVGAMFILGQTQQISETLFSNIALFMGLYTVGAWEPRRRLAFWIRALVVLAMLVWFLVSIFQTVTDPDAVPGLSRAGAFSPLAAYLMQQLLTNLLYFAGAWYSGEHAWNAARERARTRWRGRLLVGERQRVEAQAVSLERLRLARELHDAVAHHVSLMGVQAGAARVLLNTAPQQAAAALEQVEESAREAIRELQGVLGTLREAESEIDDRDDEPGGLALASLGVDRLPMLAEQSTEAGVVATFQVVGEPRPLPGLLSLNLFRIAQEALTNTRKHAGTGARADVRLRYTAEAVELEVTDDGGGSLRRSVPASAGLGQVGMQERAAIDGGTLEARPRSRGGYLVRARVPLDGGTAGRTGTTQG